MTSGAPHDAPHLPRPAPIDAYGKGGFAFADMSHRGSLVCLPSGIWSTPIRSPADITWDGLSPIVAEAASIDLLLIGAGRDSWRMPADLRARLREVSAMSVDAMSTGAAVSTYNILLGEGRRVAALLIATE